MDNSGERIVRMNNKKKKNSKIVILVIICVIIIFALVAVVLAFSGNNDSDGRVINEENYAQIKEEMDAEVADGYFETYMNTEWTFKDGTSKTEDAILGNSPNNKKPIRCEVILKETGEKVYSSNVLPVGTVLEPFKLDVDLGKGVYKAVCQIYLLDKTDDGKYVDASDAGFDVTITVDN